MSEPILSQSDLTTLRKAIGVARSIEARGGNAAWLVAELAEMLRRIGDNREVREEQPA